MTWPCPAMCLDRNGKRCNCSCLAWEQSCSSRSLPDCSDQPAQGEFGEPISPSVSLMGRKAFHSACAAGAGSASGCSSPGLSSEEQRGREPRGLTQTVKINSANASRISRTADKASTLSADLSGSYGLSAGKKKKNKARSYNFYEGLPCHSSSYWVSHVEESRHKRGITSKGNYLTEIKWSCVHTAMK